MCLAQGPQRSDAGEAGTRGPQSQVKHSTTEPLHSLLVWCLLLITQQSKIKNIYFPFQFSMWQILKHLA